jgi:hypothetical protein
MTILDLLDVTKLIDDLISRSRYGRGHKLEWPHSSVWTGMKVERTLRRYGIRTYCRDYGQFKPTKGLHVPKGQAVWADWVLRRADCPLIGPPLSKVVAGPMPADWGVPARGGGFAGVIIDMLGGSDGSSTPAAPKRKRRTERRQRKQRRGQR